MLINIQLHSAVIIRYLGMMEKIVYAFKFNTHISIKTLAIVKLREIVNQTGMRVF